MEIIRDTNAKKLAGEALVALFKKRGNQPVLFLSSGGSSLSLLEQIDKEIFRSNFTVGVIDERFSADPAVNNFLQLNEKLSDAAISSWVDSVPKASDTLATLAVRIEDTWRDWRRSNQSGKIIVTLGMGVDGHTIGIVPKSLTSDVEDFRWVVGYDAELASRFPLRVTATFGFLRNQVDSAIVYILGEEKRRALERVLADSGSLTETPARIFREMKNVKIFTGII